MIIMQGLKLKIQDNCIENEDYSVILHTTLKSDTFISKIYFRLKWIGTIKTKILNYVN